VADLTHDMPDEAFHEIHLSGKQLVFLFMATTVVSVVIFLCGVLVGRGVPTGREAADGLDPAAESVLSPQPAPVAPGSAAEAVPQATEPPAPPAETEDLSYQQRLEGTGTPRESLDTRPAETPARPVPPAEAAAASAPPKPAPKPAGPETVAGTPQPGVWVVQVHALRDRNVANGIVRRLAAKGYPAFLVAAGPPTGSYKVQVGRYKDRGEAERIVARLKKEEQFNSWITR
jgi:cell division septation protein DedD